MSTTPSVEEFQGLYGPFQVHEWVLQKIWLKTAFDSSRMQDDRGRSVKLIHPGTWNRLRGPDFKGASLMIDGALVEGDVEIHFSARDWIYHGHAEDPEFDGVVLHVVYHPLKPEDPPIRASAGKRIPTVSLVDLLWHDIEEYASEDSLLQSTGVSTETAFASLFDSPVDERREYLQALALERWTMKCRYARRRIERLGWENACHMTAMEILGYRANRIPMLRVAGALSLPGFRLKQPTLEALLAHGGDLWRTQGCRPANHPRLRLEQYLRWVATVPYWPRILQDWEATLPDQFHRQRGTTPYRKAIDLPKIHYKAFRRVCGESLSGSKLDTLVCDGWLPLLSAYSGRDHSMLWFHWYAGNAPGSLIQSLKQLGVLSPRQYPLANGWVQGALKLTLAEASETDFSGSPESPA